jgi:hypothetical protein
MHHRRSRAKETLSHRTKDKARMDNQYKLQAKKGNGKMKKDVGKWCEFHKIP